MAGALTVFVAAVDSFENPTADDGASSRTVAIATVSGGGKRPKPGQSHD